MKKLRGAFSGALLAAIAFGALAIVTPSDASAAGKGKKPPKNPPPCPCATTIEIAPGVFCVLEDCAELVPGGFECLYACPLPEF